MSERLPYRTDEQVINSGIFEAMNESRVVDNLTARYIAAQLHTGQASALYSLASCGAMSDRLVGELWRSYGEDYDDPSILLWHDALFAYYGQYGDRGPVPNWHLS